MSLKKDLHELTKEGIEKLRTELNHLKTVERERVIEEIVAARAQGDLSENADYDAARDEQARIEARIAELENILKNAKEVKKDTTDTITTGKTVTFLYLGKNIECTYTFVGQYEVDVLNNKISIDSPVGKALKAHKVDDVVNFKTEKGIEYSVKILKIEH